MTEEEERDAEAELAAQQQSRKDAARVFGVLLGMIIVGILVSWVYIVELVTSGCVR